MLIDISKVILTKDKTLTLQCDVEAKSFDYNQSLYPIQNNKPFELSIVNEEAKRLIITGNTSLDVIVPCDRCLEDVDVKFDISINKSISIANGELVVTDDEELPYINEGELDVDRLLFDEILVNWPSKVLCKDACQGICPKCGANLNKSPCDCDRRVLDPRMAQFQDVFREFKEV